MSGSSGSHKKTIAAKRLIFINALNSSRPRTEEGQPVLYSQIKSRLKYRDNDEFSIAFHRSVRALSDPDIHASLVHGNEEFFTNSVGRGLERQDSFGSVERLDVPGSPSRKEENRKSVKDVITKFEGFKAVSLDGGNGVETIIVDAMDASSVTKPRSKSDMIPVKRRPVPVPRKKSNTKSISPYQVVDLIRRPESSYGAHPVEMNDVILRLSTISDTSMNTSTEDDNAAVAYDVAEKDESVIENNGNHILHGKLNSPVSMEETDATDKDQNDTVDGDCTAKRETKPTLSLALCKQLPDDDQLSPLRDISPSPIPRTTTVTSPVVRSRFISDPTPLDITVYKTHSIDLPEANRSPISRNSNVSNRSDMSWYSEDCGWDSDEFDNSDDETSLLDSTKEDKENDSGVDKKIFNIVNEILTTERTYVRRLHLLDKIFYDKLLLEAKKNGSVQEKTVHEVFSNLSPIADFHTQILLPDLESRMTSWSSNAKIGDIFRTLGHCLKLYSHYVANFDNASKVLNSAMKKSPKFSAVIEEIQRLPESENLSLQHHMLEPIQRVPRYKLLLTDYLKRLPEDSADREEAEESLVVISKAAEHANDSMKHMDKFKKLLELQDRITEGLHGETLVTASRVFVKEGDVSKIAARSDHRMPRTLLLFNDVLLCCSKVSTTGKLKVKQIMDMDGMMLQDGVEVDLAEKFAFRVRSRQRVLDLAVSNDEDKHDWLNAVAKSIADYAEKRGPTRKPLDDELVGLEKGNSLQIGLIAPVWVKDDDVSMCMLCASRFWLANRRHHCRGCGRACCENCSKYKAALPYADNALKRVCYSCHKKLANEQVIAPPPSRNLSTLRRDKRKRNSNIPAFVSGELLWKQPNKGWTRDWFALLSDFVLYAHRKKQDVKAFFTLPIPGWTIEPVTQGEELEGDRQHVFKLHHQNKRERTYYFEADDKETNDRWLEALTYASRAEIPPSAQIVEEFLGESF